ncbi:hypothetical protein CAQUA_02110 [Corynebacterium aquatimens]|nr:hypothetical protein CAQUA_02110 [Corynebacterium aquatimens]
MHTEVCQIRVRTPKIQVKIKDMDRQGEIELIKRVHGRTKDCIVTGPAAAVLMDLATHEWVRQVDLKRRSGTNAGSRKQNKHGAVYRSGRFREDRVQTSHGIPHVDGTQMLLDTYRYYGRLAALVTLESARFKWQQLTTQYLLEQLDDVPSANGIRDFRRLIHYSVETSQSPLETIVRDQIIQADIPEVHSIEAQVKVTYIDGQGRVRTAWIDFMINNFLGLEADGEEKISGKYGDPTQVLLDERSRQIGINNKGIPIIRVTWDDAIHGRVPRIVQEALIAYSSTPRRTL